MGADPDAERGLPKGSQRGKVQRLELGFVQSAGALQALRLLAQRCEVAELREAGQLEKSMMSGPDLGGGQAFQGRKRVGEAIASNKFNGRGFLLLEAP